MEREKVFKADVASVAEVVGDGSEDIEHGADSRRSRKVGLKKKKERKDATDKRGQKARGDSRGK